MILEHQQCKLKILYKVIHKLILTNKQVVNKNLNKK